MKSKVLLSTPALSLLAALALPHPLPAQPQPAHYTVTDLGPTDSPFAQATGISNNSFVSGFAVVADGTQHAVVWYKGRMIDIARPGLLGPNSGAFGINARAQAAVLAEINSKDPNNENFCAYGTGLLCRPFFWQGGVYTPLPLLGGNNGGVNYINAQGAVAGEAENNVRDPECTLGVEVNGNGPQVLDYEAVIWGPGAGQIRLLPPLPGDTVSAAMWINDGGQAVGVSGRCGNTILPGAVAGPHAVMWDRDGSVHDLGNLGGTSNPEILAVGNAALAINNAGQVTGVSALPGSKAIHPFLWTSDKGMQDLGLLPGDLFGAGLAMNSRGDIVGASISAPGLAGGNPRAFVRLNGVMHDLNDLAPADSPLYLLTAFGINDAGEIVGFGADGDGNLHGFLATPCGGNSGADRCENGTAAAAAELLEHTERPKVVLSDNARKLLLQRGLGRH